MVKQIDIINEVGQNFIDFSYEANSARAFADARDGFKPGQRACIWEMYSKGYTSSKPHVKSAKIDGAVAGNWWPHGNVALYDTFVRMSQWWLNNIPEVDIHGNNGSVYSGPDPASDRYTEARLSKIAEVAYFQGIKKNAVNMIPNYSEDDEWPEVLPAILPRLMINGCQGIGSTIANVWLPHNVKDLTKVISKYVNENILDYSELYPDFPVKSIIINKKDIPVIYETGKGKVITRGITEIKGNKILITSLPYQVYVQPYVEKLIELATKEEITGIEDVVNKSGKKTFLIEVECSSNPEGVLKQLYSKTDLQKSFSANQWALIGKTPKLLTLKEYLDVYIQHNILCIKREAEFDLKKAKDRLEIVEGLLKALEDIDNIIALIKKSASAAAAKENLITTYAFTESQAKAIVGMRLGSLANLEKIELNQEKEDLINKVNNLNILIQNEDKQKEEFLSRLNNIVNKYGTERKTEVTQINLEITKEEKEIAEIIPEDVIVVATSNSIKRVPVASFRPQRRGGKGIKNEGEIIIFSFKSNTQDKVQIFTSLGKMYGTLVDNLVSSTVAGKGMNYLDLIKIEPNEKVIAVSSLHRTSVPKYAIFFTSKGYIKKSLLSEYTSPRASGITAIKLEEDDSLVNIIFMDEEPVLLITKDGMSIKFDTKNISAIGRNTRGVKAIKLAEGDKVVAAMAVHKETDDVAIFAANGLGKKVSLKEFPSQARGGKGTIVYKGESLVGAAMVDDEDNILLSGSSFIVISAKDIPLLGKVALGNILTKNKIQKITKI